VTEYVPAKNRECPSNISQFSGTLWENYSLLGTDNVRGQRSEHIFTPNGGYCLYVDESCGIAVMDQLLDIKALLTDLAVPRKSVTQSWRE